jgi:N4-gp56 family major capsid protein
MADQFTGTVNSGAIGPAYANLVVAGYDRYLEYALRSRPLFRQLVDKHPVDVTNPGPTVTLSIVNEFSALATTPLVENVDVAAVAPPDVTRVTVSVNEYGNADLETLKLKQLAFTPVDPAIAISLGKNMVDTLDKLAQNQLDAATNIIGVNATVVKTNTNGFAEASVAAGDKFTSEVARDAVALLRRRNALGRDNADNFLAVIHPDVAVDIMSDTGWLNPHQYVNTDGIYNAEVGTYLGARYLMSPRATVVADGAASAKVYRTYFVGGQALVEAVVSGEHIVIGPQTDKLRRFFPIGWLYHGGFSIFRQECIQIARTASSISAL